MFTGRVAGEHKVMVYIYKTRSPETRLSPILGKVTLPCSGYTCLMGRKSIQRSRRINPPLPWVEKGRQGRRVRE